MSRFKPGTLEKQSSTIGVGFTTAGRPIYVVDAIFLNCFRLEFWHVCVRFPPELRHIYALTATATQGISNGGRVLVVIHFTY